MVQGSSTRDSWHLPLQVVSETSGEPVPDGSAGDSKASATAGTKAPGLRNKSTLGRIRRLPRSHAEAVWCRG